MEVLAEPASSGDDTDGIEVWEVDEEQRWDAPKPGKDEEEMAAALPAAFSAGGHLPTTLGCARPWPASACESHELTITPGKLSTDAPFFFLALLIVLVSCAATVFAFPLAFPPTRPPS